MSAEFVGSQPKNCGYRYLGNYYQNMWGVSMLPEQERPKFLVAAVFGGTPYASSSSSSGGSGGALCNTWRRGSCCDNRATGATAYSNCASGICARYEGQAANY